MTLCPLFFMKFNSLLQNPTANMNKLNYSIGFYCSKKQFLQLMRTTHNILKKRNITLNDKDAPM